MPVRTPSPLPPRASRADLFSCCFPRALTKRLIAPFPHRLPAAVTPSRARRAPHPPSAHAHAPGLHALSLVSLPPPPPPLAHGGTTPCTHHPHSHTYTPQQIVRSAPRRAPSPPSPTWPSANALPPCCSHPLLSLILNTPRQLVTLVQGRASWVQARRLSTAPRALHAAVHAAPRRPPRRPAAPAPWPPPAAAHLPLLLLLVVVLLLLLLQGRCSTGRDASPRRR